MAGMHTNTNTASSTSSKNKSYVQTLTGAKSFHNGSAQLLNLFPQVQIQANKKIELAMYVPVRSHASGWGGLYINTNAKVNGTWYNLGNCGYDGNAMSASGASINSYTNSKILDFVGSIGLDQTQPFTVQIELLARSYSGSSRVNQSHDINTTGNNLGNRGAVQPWGSDQNYCTLIIKEMDR